MCENQRNKDTERTWEWVIVACNRGAERMGIGISLP